MRLTVEHTPAATSREGDRKVGVVWHTQESRKACSWRSTPASWSSTRAWRTRPSWSSRIATNLDDQLFGTFSQCKELVRQAPQQAGGRDELRRLLDRPGGVIFTTIQKFTPETGTNYPLLTDRRNVIVIADEANRSQYGFGAKI